MKKQQAHGLRLAIGNLRFGWGKWAGMPLTSRRRSQKCGICDFWWFGMENQFRASTGRFGGFLRAQRFWRGGLRFKMPVEAVFSAIEWGVLGFWQ